LSGDFKTSIKGLIMPHSTTSYSDAYDRQETITDCLSSVIDLIAQPKKQDFSLVDRNDFSLLLGFLSDELNEDDSFSALAYSKANRQDLFVNCYGAISDLTISCDDLHQVGRDNLFFILNFLHQELKRVNAIMYALNKASGDKVILDKKGDVLMQNQPFEKDSSSIAVGE
jgi:hypothetical protein